MRHRQYDIICVSRVCLGNIYFCVLHCSINVTSENWNWPILIVCAVIYGVLLVLLMVYEGMQLFILHRQYLKEMENYIEWFVFLVAMGTPFIKVTC